MKIVFLNCWQGELLEPLQTFIESQKASTDVFCLQEANVPVQTALDSTLRLYTKNIVQKNITKLDSQELHTMHQVTYIKQGIEILESRALLQNAHNTGFGLYTHLVAGTKPVHIVNLHGYPWPGKLDTPTRIEQSEEFLTSLQSARGARIIGGDLNVLPGTKSVEMFADSGYQDLIQTHDIKTTRNHLSWDRFPDNPMYYSDYVFVDANTTVTRFTVPDVEISDHLPMILEILL